MEVQASEQDAEERTEWTAGGVAITRHPGRCGGDPTISGSRIGVAEVVALARRYDWDLPRVQEREFSDLSVAEIAGAVEYYRGHVEEIEEILRRDREFLEQLPPAPMGPKARA